MKEAFEKIIERFEEELEWSSTHGKDVKFREGRLSGLRTGMRIVKEVAEEYKDKYITVPKDDFTEHLINMGYNKGLKDANNEGWIPVSSGKLPEEKENPVTRDWYVYPVMVKFEEITDIRYYSFGNGHWHHGPGIMDKYVTHWMDIKPYQPKGEK